MIDLDDQDDPIREGFENSQPDATGRCPTCDSRPHNCLCKRPAHPQPDAVERAYHTCTSICAKCKQETRDATAVERERCAKLKHNLNNNEGTGEWRAGYKLAWRQYQQAIYHDTAIREGK